MKKPLLILLIAILALTALACEISASDIEMLIDLLPTSEPYTDPALYGNPPFDCIPTNEIEYATVTFIYDGDTIQVEMDGEKYKVRFVGINTPERETFYFWEATQANAELLPIGTEVMLIRDTNDVDKYDRLVRYVVADDVFVNYELVLNGYAYSKTYHPDTACDATFKAAMQTAEENQVGLHQP